jgi:RimJ/RimL family protein N-acetyltransferase
MTQYHYNGVSRTLMVGPKTIRPAVLADSRFIYRLSMDPSVRMMSTRAEEFDFASHDRWYREKLSDGENRIWIMEVTNIPVGQVRYGRCEEDAEIAISISPTERGKGYARELLLTTEPWAMDWLHVSKLVALVLKTNEASARLFLSAGYRLEGNEMRMNKAHWRFEKP